MLNGGVSQFVPKCPVLSLFVLFCPSWGPERGQIGTKEDKRGQNGTKAFCASYGNPSNIWEPFFQLVLDFLITTTTLWTKQIVSIPTLSKKGRVHKGLEETWHMTSPTSLQLQTRNMEQPWLSVTAMYIQPEFQGTRRLDLSVHTVGADFGEGDETKHFSVTKKGFSVKRGEAIQLMRGLVRISTGKAIQWRGPGHSVNRRTLEIEELLSSSPSRKSALIMQEPPLSHRLVRTCPFYTSPLCRIPVN